jgi:TIR domain/Tetratricopeptide repeat
LARIFISHSSKDLDQATKLKAWLASVGFERAFLDFDKHAGISPGADWERTLYQELERAQAVILILTRNWFDSKWCFAEFTQGRAQGKAIFALIESPTGETSIVSSDIQHLDLTANYGEGLDRLRRELERVALDAQGGFDWPEGRAPYPGLMSFEAADAAVFFGRDDDVRRLIERVNARRVQGGAKLVTILGGSGSGKSSLMKAGLLPRLERDKTHYLVAPPFRPGADPVRSLFGALKAIDMSLIAADLDVVTAEAGQALIDRLRRAAMRPQATLIIAVDQAEEVFTRASEAACESFFRLLSALMADDNTALAVLALRADHLPDMQKLDLAGATLPETETFPLKPMPVERMGLVVEGPARVVGIKVEDGLAAAIMRDASTADALPLAAFVLRRLYDRHSSSGQLGVVHYESLREGTLSPLEAAIRDAAKEALDAAKPSADELAALREAFVPAMVRVNDEGGFVRQAARRERLPQAARRLIARLIDARLLAVRRETVDVRPEGDSRAARGGDEPQPSPIDLIEVAHEAIFRVWPLLATWLEGEREFLIGKSRIERAREDFAKLDEAERRKGYLSRILLERAKNWLIAHPARFSSDEASFIQLSAAEAARLEAERAAEQERLRRAELAQAKAEAERAEEAERRAWERAATARRWQLRALAAAAIFAVIGGFAVFEWRRATQETARAEEQRVLAEQQKERAERQKDIADRNFAAAKQAIDALIFNIVQGLGDVAGMKRETVHSILETVRLTVNKLIEAAPDDPQLLRSEAVMFDNFAKTYLTSGDTADARGAASQSVEIARKLAARSAEDAQAERDLSVFLNTLGDAKRLTGDQAGALAAYQESYAITRKLAAADSGNAQAQRDVAVGLNKLGDMKLQAGDQAGALAAYQEALDLVRKLTAQDPGDARAQRDVALGLGRLGDVKRAGGDQAGALAAYREALDIVRKLAPGDVANTQLQRDVSVNLNKLGDMKGQAGDQAGALAAYQEGLDIARKLAAQDLGNAQAQRDVAVSLNKLGNAKRQGGDLAGALAAYRESLDIVRKLAAQDPGNALARSDFLFGLNRLGDVKYQAGDEAGALAAYQEVLDFVRKLAAQDSANPQLQRDVAVSLNKLGDMKLQTGDQAGALAAYQEGLDIARRLAAQRPGNAQAQRDVAVSVNKLGDAKSHAGDLAGALAAYQEGLDISRNLAAQDPDGALTQGDLVFCLSRIAALKQKSGDLKGALDAYEESIAVARKLAAEFPGSAPAQRDLASRLFTLADMRLKIGDRSGALEAYRDVLAFLRKLQARYPQNVEVESGMVSALLGIASLDSAPLPSYQEALEILKTLDRDGKATSRQKDLIASIEAKLGAPAPTAPAAP